MSEGASSPPGRRRESLQRMVLRRKNLAGVHHWLRRIDPSLLWKMDAAPAQAASPIPDVAIS
jgi:hypothetical protein